MASNFFIRKGALPTWHDLYVANSNDYVEEIKKVSDIPVRAWNGEEPFFGQTRQLKEKHLEKYAVFGVTDMITNVPEMYLNN